MQPAITLMQHDEENDCQMQDAREYRDTWRGLRISAPKGWQARRWGLGLLLHDGEARQALREGHTCRFPETRQV